jgi:uncharacterized protein (DUF2336 family)
MPHDVAALTDPIAATDASQARPAARPVAPQSLIDELEAALAKQDLRYRAAVMRRVTDLFILNGTGFSEEHIAMFDDVMSRLVAAIDTSARAEFGERLASHPHAPPKTSRILALDDDVEVARPFLSQSTKLDEGTLVESAKTKSQEHLYAISLREAIGEKVTDILVERGNEKVVRSTAENPGAKFSEFGCSTLAMRSAADSELALRVWTRNDIPRHHLLSLFAGASVEVQKQLEAADRQKGELYRFMIAHAKNRIQESLRDVSSTYEQARLRVESLLSAGELTEDRVLAFANEGKFDEVTIALSWMCDLPVGHIERAMVHNQVDHLLVLAKALDLSWPTTKAILLLRAPQKGTHKDPDGLFASFNKLQRKTAISAMQFYRLRAKAEAQVADLETPHGSTEKSHA